MQSLSQTHTGVRIFLLPILAVAVFLMMVGCGSGNGGGNINPTTTVSVVVFPGAVTAPINGLVVFTATVYNSTNTAVNWAATGGGSFAGNILTVPGTPGPITVTATLQADTTKTATVTVTVTAAQPVSVSPSAVAVLANGIQQFQASSGGQAVVWAAIAPGGGDPGHIDQSGNYTAPLVPPPGGTVTISAVSVAGAGTANVTILFSSASLLGQFAFSYSGQDAAGFLAVAGSITFDGLGNVTPGGVEDVNSGNGVVTNPITGGTYEVGPDGRTTVAFTTSQATVTLQVTIISPQHALLVRFDTVATGSGTLDLQNKAELAVSAVSNFYSFAVSGINSGGFPEAIAGNFFADGNGDFPINRAIQDVNDAGTITQADVSLQGQIVTFDSNAGRGLLQFTSTTKGTLTFAFYIVDHSHLKLVENDQAPILAGDAFSAPNSIALTSLTGNNSFTLGGAVTKGAYAAGGIFTSTGTGTVSGGVQDLNVAGRVLAQNIATSGSTYTITPPSSNRILLNVSNGSTTFTYGVYINSNGTAEMIELDTNVVVASGLAYLQSSTAAPQGNYALNLTGAVGKGEEDVNGAIVSSSAAAFTGYLDANNSGSIFPNLPLTGNTTTAPTTLGRGAITLQTAPPSPTSFALAYYVVDNQTCLLVEIDSQRVMVGIMSRQF
ncbi:MAG TPA: hypothetical protein VEX69_01170 [Candidatus Limnocylindria bacterium]|nr:hypothetical protein [Candidatus Limnocylindria bacterium]